MDLANIAVALCATTKYALELLPKVARVFVSLNGTFDTNTFIPEAHDQSFFVGNAHYLAVASSPVLSIPYRLDHFSSGPITYISALSANTTGEELRQVINHSFEQDDVFIKGFLDDILNFCDWLYSIEDTRPLAGQRIGVKDIYDLEGIQTTAGSQAYVAVNGVAKKTAPALQRIIDLGGVLVGKQKTAQFASPAYPWDWNDEYYPRNPRGDTFLSCSGSSAGAGCSVAAYDWLDFAVGTDTGMSVRQPAAFSGTYGNRPSQGMILMSNIVTNAYNTDTAGVIARDPARWASFSKAWYDPSLHEHTSLNGLPALSLPDDRTFPKRILYPVDHLPLQNPAAEAILQRFLSDVSTTLGATVENFNLSATIEAVATRPLSEVSGDLFVLWTHDLIAETAKSLLAEHAPVLPPLDEPYRQVFHSLTVPDEVYQAAMKNRTRDAAAWHEKVLFSTDESCSESILIYDIGTGGLPSFRERDLNDMPGAALPADPIGLRAASMVASYFGDVDYTVPLGQVSYLSNVTYQEETMPVTVNIVAKRGCDFVLFNMINELAHRGVLKTVLTGQTAFGSQSRSS
ncbi:amidase [Colletotrichum caudatum]|nr:amidase [Colletotrichum caudatum]